MCHDVLIILVVYCVCVLIIIEFVDVGDSFQINTMLNVAESSSNTISDYMISFDIIL